MTLQYLSDLHLEFPENLNFIKENPITPVSETLLMAGDILCLHLINDKLYSDFFSFLSDNWKQVLWIPGNHEYYGNNLLSDHSSIDRSILHDNIRLVNNQTIHLDEVRVLCTTLWSHIPDRYTSHIRSGMNDFRAIKYDGKKLTTDRYNRLHQNAKQYLINELTEDYAGDTVVLTHHVPTRNYYPPQYAGDILNYAFASELSSIIEEYKIHSWVYGHHHQYVPAFEMNDISFLNNQLGYVAFKEHGRWDSEAYIHL